MAFFVIDGMNVCYYGKQCVDDRKSKSNRPDLRVLFIILIELMEQGHQFHCVFDASFKGKLDKISSQKFNELIKSHQYFSVVTGGTRADDSVLNIAYHNNGYIISNDRFRNEIENNQNLTWLNDNHLIKGNRMMDIITINTPNLHINQKIQGTSEQYADYFFKLFLEYKKKIKQQTQNISTNKPQNLENTNPKPTSAIESETPSIKEDPMDNFFDNVSTEPAPLNRAQKAIARLRQLNRENSSL